MGKTKYTSDDYDLFIEEYKRISIENNQPISHRKLRDYGLPSASGIMKHAGVCQWRDFVKLCGFYSHGVELTKEYATELIYKLSEQLCRPLMYDDFRGRGCYHVPIEFIRNTWGSMNKMKEELGLEINKESMVDKQLSQHDFDEMIENICKYVTDDNRNFITTREIDKNNEYAWSDTLRKMCKKYYNCTLGEHFKKYNINLGKQGNGINFDFSDGEHVTSQYEYMFSKFLKSRGLRFNIDYFRDYKYSKIDGKYNGNMNCDYVINYNSSTIYIEIAGIIANYKNWYYKNKQISYSKSKEYYSQKLHKKEEILQRNNCLYFLLFPCDLTMDNFMSILEKPTTQLRKDIESFIKNNIDWVKVRTIGELDYSQDINRDNHKNRNRKTA